MIFVNGVKPDRNAIEGAAGALGIAEAFVEKDWHVTRILGLLASFEFEGCTLVFGGGTSLSKAYGLLERFSEDIDFRVAPHTEVETLSEGSRRRLRKAVETAITDAGYQIDNDRTERWNGNRMFALFVPFQSEFSHDGLRSEVKIEVTVSAPILPEKHCSLGSISGAFRNEDSEVTSITCVDPTETAADKLAALSWRVFEQKDLPDIGENSRDGTLMRHVYDLHALEQVALGDGRFAGLLRKLIQQDRSRGKTTSMDRPSEPRDLLQKTITCLRELPFPKDYDDYVMTMTYGAKVPSYEMALGAIERLSKEI